ncbi:hypothetical protein TNCV_4758731 [Trichonephila clavipes]|nr:hypothetical protein TNCV_4758731 [Trichonephila clavipes]
MNVTVDGYDGKGITQCYSCNDSTTQLKTASSRQGALSAGKRTKRVTVKYKELKKDIVSTAKHTGTWQTTQVAPNSPNHVKALKAANLEPVHSSPSSSHKAAFQPFQDGIFHHFDFVSKCLIATPFLHVPTTNQVVPSPPRTATPSGTINNYVMGWRLALRTICLATDSD